MQAQRATTQALLSHPQEVAHVRDQRARGVIHVLAFFSDAGCRTGTTQIVPGGGNSLACAGEMRFGQQG